VRELARKLGWEEELQKAWEATASSVETEKVETAAAVKESSSEVSNKREKEHLQTEIDKLTSDVEKSLALTDNPTDEKKETTNSNISAKQEKPAPQTSPQKEEKPSAAESDGAEGLHGSTTQVDGKL
jgi:NAD-dependent histone deacetylase SIR2